MILVSHCGSEAYPEAIPDAIEGEFWRILVKDVLSKPRHSGEYMYLPSGSWVGTDKGRGDRGSLVWCVTTLWMSVMIVVP